MARVLGDAGVKRANGLGGTFKNLDKGIVAIEQNARDTLARIVRVRGRENVVEIRLVHARCMRGIDNSFHAKTPSVPCVDFLRMRVYVSGLNDNRLTLSGIL